MIILQYLFLYRTFTLTRKTKHKFAVRNQRGFALPLEIRILSEAVLHTLEALLRYFSNEKLNLIFTFFAGKFPKSRK